MQIFHNHLLIIYCLRMTLKNKFVKIRLFNIKKEKTLEKTKKKGKWTGKEIMIHNLIILTI
jgi:hypothetical protein